MSAERRITENPRDNKLKSIAGLIQGLSYREMKQLSTLVYTHVDHREEFVAEGLLTVADEILSK